MTIAVDLGRKATKQTNKQIIIGPPPKRHLNDVSLASRWCPNIECWLGSFLIFQGIRTGSIAQKPYTFVIFQGVRTPCPPCGSAHVILLQNALVGILTFMSRIDIMLCSVEHENKFYNLVAYSISPLNR